MVARPAWAVIRSVLFWGIPAVLVATLAWTFVPRGRSASPASVRLAAPDAGGLPRPSAEPSAPGSATTRTQPAPGTGTSAQPGSGAAPFAEIRRGDLEGSDETGRRQWRVVADAVTVIHDKGAVLLRNVRATFYERSGGSIVVTGARGRFDTKTHEVEIDGRVHGKSSTGRELFADQLRWVPRAGTLTGTGHIRLFQERVVMYADEMTSDAALRQTQFFGHVHASVR